MIRQLFLCIIAVTMVKGSPQFVTFKDGRIGVNFGGYTAEAGLGGLLTGNAADGGLSASAGTPFGQRAAAGIGGLENGNAAGTAYAGAQATDTIGASAVIGGNTGNQQSGILGAEAHANGKAVTKVITTQEVSPSHGATSTLVVPTDLPKVNVIQKVKLPKKYATATNVESRFGGNGSPAISTNGNSDVAYTKNGKAVHRQISSGALDSYLNIPIGILQSIRDNLRPI